MASVEEDRATIADAIRRHNGEGNGKSNGKTTWREPLHPLDLAEFLALDIKPIEMILTPLLPTKGIVTIFADRGVGKTLLALSCAIAISTGTTALQGWSAPAARRVLYVDSEMPGATMQQRLTAAQAAAMERPEPGYFRMLCGDIIEGGLPDLSTEAGRSELDAAICDAQVVVLDNRATLMKTARENESDDWVGVQDWFLDLRRRERAIVMLDHAGRSGFQRGTSRREDVTDTIVKLRRPENYRPDQGARFVVEFVKARGVWGNDALPFIAQYTEYNKAALWTRVALGDEAEEQVAEMTSRGMSVRAIAKASGISKSRAQRLHDQAIQREIFDKGNQE